jgi:hypothetical protein
MVEMVSRPSSRKSAQTERGIMPRMDNPKYLQLLRLLADILCMPRWQDHKEMPPKQLNSSQAAKEGR